MFDYKRVANLMRQGQGERDLWSQSTFSPDIFIDFHRFSRKESPNSLMFSCRKLDPLTRHQLLQGDGSDGSDGWGRLGVLGTLGTGLGSNGPMAPAGTWDRWIRHSGGGKESFWDFYLGTPRAWEVAMEEIPWFFFRTMVTMVFFYVKKTCRIHRIHQDTEWWTMVKRYRGEGTRWYTVKVHVINNERYHGEGCSDPTVDEDGPQWHD